MNLITKTNLVKGSNFKIEDASKALSLKKVNTPNYRYVMHRLMGISPEEYTDIPIEVLYGSRIYP